MHKLLSLVLVSGLSLGLIGCSDPTFMPAGYTYHNDVYKAPPGPEADDLGYEYSAAKNNEILQVWRIAAIDLVDQLEEQTGKIPQAIYVYKRKANAFNASYDHVLREELRGRGYTLVSSVDAAPLALWYESHVPVDAAENERPVYNDDPVAGYQKLSDDQDFVLILTMLREGEFFGKSAGIYKLPSYGYEEEYAVLADSPVPTEPSQ